MTTSVIITGGGTAGHTNPGIATAQALVAAGLPADEIHFVGGERGNEGTIVPDAGFGIDLLPGRGIQRRLTFANVGAVIDLIRGMAQAFRIVRRRRPAVVLCLGGYAAFGASVAAIVQRIPVVVTEQNARASAVNRWIGRFAKVCALPFPDTDLPNGELTGNPIRPAIVSAVAAADVSSARTALGLSPTDVIVAVWSGSLGAAKINAAVRELADRWSDRSGITIHHVVGRRDWPGYVDGPAAFADAALDYRAVEYEERMPELLVAADLAVCRSGASTVTELAVAGLPAVLVPLPGAPRDHQTANSREVVEAGGALLLADADVTAERLDELLSPLVDDRATREQMSRAAASVARPEAADRVAGLLIDIGELELAPT